MHISRIAAIIGVFGALWISQSGCSSQEDQPSGPGISDITAAADAGVSEDEVPLDLELKSPYRGLSFHYPSTWKAKIYKEGKPDDVPRLVHRATFKSPSGKVTVEFDDGIYGIGGNEETNILETLSVQKLPSAPADFKSAVYIESVMTIAPDAYWPTNPALLQKGQWAVGFGLVGDYAPVGQRRSYGMSLILEGRNNEIPFLSFGVADLDNHGTERFKTQAEAEAFFQNPEYKTAKRMILSLEGLGLSAAAAK